MMIVGGNNLLKMVSIIQTNRKPEAKAKAVVKSARGDSIFWVCKDTTSERIKKPSGPGCQKSVAQQYSH
jgi:hypothetical protein